MEAVHYEVEFRSEESKGWGPYHLKQQEFDMASHAFNYARDLVRSQLPNGDGCFLRVVKVTETGGKKFCLDRFDNGQWVRVCIKATDTEEAAMNIAINNTKVFGYFYRVVPVEGPSTITREAV